MRRACRSATPATHRASGARPARRARHARDHARPPVRQGRARQVHAAGVLERRARELVVDAEGCSRCSTCRTASHAVQRRHEIRRGETYDIEGWMPSYERWMEISSCSNFELPGAPREHPLPRRLRQARVRPHPQRLRRRPRAHCPLPARDLAARGRQHRGPAAAPPVHGRPGPHRLSGTNVTITNFCHGFHGWPRINEKKPRSIFVFAVRRR